MLPTPNSTSQAMWVMLTNTRGRGKGELISAGIDWCINLLSDSMHDRSVSQHASQPTNQPINQSINTSGNSKTLCQSNAPFVGRTINQSHLTNPTTNLVIIILNFPLTWNSSERSFSKCKFFRFAVSKLFSPEFHTNISPSFSIKIFFVALSWEYSFILELVLSSGYESSWNKGCSGKRSCHFNPSFAAIAFSHVNERGLGRTVTVSLHDFVNCLKPAGWWAQNVRGQDGGRGSYVWRVAVFNRLTVLNSFFMSVF